ncbi:MAG: FtsQ-type POTRA domain-containing protein [Actinomycetota bacterium]
MTARIDPRLRQRRIAVRRAEGRRRLRILLVALGVAAVVAGAYAITRSALLDLDRIEVDGAVGSEVAEVTAATGLELGAPLTDLDLDAAGDAVTALPWVASADVVRSWPGTVTVDVRRRIPIALLPTGDGGGIVIDTEGVAIARTPNTITELPVITVTAAGELGEVQDFALPALPVVEAVPADLVPWIETYGIDYERAEEAELVIDLVGSAVAELGVGTDIEAKLESLRAVLGRVDRDGICLIDLRVAELPVVRREPDCDVAPPAS